MPVMCGSSRTSPRRLRGAEGRTARILRRRNRAADRCGDEGQPGHDHLEDLQRYRAVERTTLRGTYRGHEVVTMPPPSSGGIAVLQMLAMLEPFDLPALGQDAAA